MVKLNLQQLLVSLCLKTLKLDTLEDPFLALKSVFVICQTWNIQVKIHPTPVVKSVSKVLQYFKVISRTKRRQKKLFMMVGSGQVMLE